MEAILKIRLSLSVIVFLIIMHVPMLIYASTYSINIKATENLSLETINIYNDIISQKKDIIWGRVVDVNIGELFLADTLLIALDNEKAEGVVVYKNAEEGYLYIHYSSINTDVYLSILDNIINADIRTESTTYKMFSVSEKEAIIAKYEEDYIEEEPKYTEYSKKSDTIDDDLYRSGVPSNTPIIRVLFLYTNAALNLVASYPYYAETEMRIVAYNYINNANESFQNSGINAHLQLAYIGPTNYDESTQTWDKALKHFYESGDGYMDNVHTLRNKYAADVCVLFLDKNDYCGEAKAIKANTNTAFCLVYPTYGCNSKFTAVHEIGHLIGCRHNYEADINLLPYGYGHGYYHYEAGSPATSWRTMMSYANKCDNDESKCRRILYWSNHNVYYNGIATGTSTIAYNARVWNERANDVSLFRDKPNEITYTATNNNTQALFESIEAVSRITTKTGFEIQSNQVVEMQASQYIRLLPSTYIKNGARFKASISTSADGGNYPQFVQRESHISENIDLLEKDRISSSATKILRNGQLFIIRDGKTFTVTGQEVK